MTIALIATGWVGLSGLAVALCAAAKRGDAVEQVPAPKLRPVPVVADDRAHVRRAA